MWRMFSGLIFESRRTPRPRQSCVSDCFERHFESAKDAKTVQIQNPLKFKWIGLETHLGDHWAVNRWLAKYIYNATFSFFGQVQYGVATDEGAVQGLALQPTVWVLPSNQAAISAPQVFSVATKLKPVGGAPPFKARRFLLL